MNKLSKEQLWKAMQYPANRVCSNCKYDDEPAHENCQGCGRWFFPPEFGYKARMDKTYTDNWGWDGQTK